MKKGREKGVKEPRVNERGAWPLEVYKSEK
jgi:hypothetical protein